MRPPPVVGVIDRRLLVNYRVEPEVISRLLPDALRPQLVGGSAVAGICLPRMASLRPAGMPARVGVGSEGAAHRIAVEWDEADGVVRRGVYIPRRDTDSRLNRLVGGRLYPGEHHAAAFVVQETDPDYAVAVHSRDGAVTVEVHLRVTDTLRGSALFADTAAASRFFEGGAVGWSATHRGDDLDGLLLQTDAWHVEPAAIGSVRSSYFEDVERFPAGSAVLDCALVMRRVPVRWRALPRRRGSGAGDENRTRTVSLGS